MKSMFKKTLAVFLSAVMLIAAVPLSAAAATIDEAAQVFGTGDSTPDEPSPGAAEVTEASGELHIHTHDKAGSEAVGSMICPQCNTYIPDHMIVYVDRVEPSCTMTGLTEGQRCPYCDAVIVEQQVIPATGHSLVVDDAVPAGCTQPGHTVGIYCSVCSQVLLAPQEIPPTGHNEVIDESRQPTCTENGVTEGSHCSNCGRLSESRW